jgi:hypothetical protein
MLAPRSRVPADSPPHARPGARLGCHDGRVALGHRSRAMGIPTPPCRDRMKRSSGRLPSRLDPSLNGPAHKLVYIDTIERRFMNFVEPSHQMTRRELLKASRTDLVLPLQRLETTMTKPTWILRHKQVQQKRAHRSNRNVLSRDEFLTTGGAGTRGRGARHGGRWQALVVRSLRFRAARRPRQRSSRVQERSPRRGDDRGGPSR